MNSVSCGYVYKGINDSVASHNHNTSSLSKQDSLQLGGEGTTSHVTYHALKVPTFSFFPRRSFCSISWSQQTHLLLNASFSSQDITSRPRLPLSSSESPSHPGSPTSLPLSYLHLSFVQPPSQYDYHITISAKLPPKFPCSRLQHPSLAPATRKEPGSGWLASV